MVRAFLILYVITFLFCFCGCIPCVVVDSADAKECITPVKVPERRLYIKYVTVNDPNYEWAGFLKNDLNELNLFLNQNYPQIFSGKETGSCQPIGLYYNREAVEEYAGGDFLTALLCLGSGFILPGIDEVEIANAVTLLCYDESVPPERTFLRIPSVPPRLSSTATIENKVHCKEYNALMLTAWIWPRVLPNKGEIQWNGFVNGSQIQHSYNNQILAALIMKAYNSDPDFVKKGLKQLRPSTHENSSPTRQKTPQLAQNASSNLSDYSILRRHFDAVTCVGKYRIKFTTATPSNSVLSDVMEDLRQFCIATCQKNNSTLNANNLLVLNEDYRAIGKSLMLYEFTIKLGAVEFLNLQYDNSTLLGSITIRLPGGNPENARKWVTENLDRLVEEYNISADEVIAGEYQLTSEKMAADGVYTVEFEVTN